MAEYVNDFSYKAQNNAMKRAIIDSIAKLFPIEASGKQLILKDVKIEDNLDDFDFPKQREIKLNRKTWHMPIYANLEIRDTKTSKILDKLTKKKIGYLPKITNRYSMLIDGNEYQTTNQFRRKSGVYSRIKKNGQLEAEFNLSKGKNFKMMLDPITGIFYLIFSNRKYRVWTLLNLLGATDKELEKAWGKDILNKNKKGAKNTEESELKSIYRIIYNKEPKNYIESLAKIKDYFTNGTEMDGSVNKITLGQQFDKVNKDSLIATSKKLLSITRGELEPDERDSLIFKDFYTIDDLVKSYFDKTSSTIKKKLERSLSLRDRIKDIIPTSTFYEPVKKFFISGDLASPPPQTNPVTILTETRKTTPMGTGGIENEHAVTEEMRNVHPSHFGFLDVLATPECYDKDTKVLTIEGWKYIKDVTKEDKILCLNNNIATFRKPIKIFKHKYNDKLISYTDYYLNFNVSSNHKVFISNDGESFEKENIKNVLSKDVYYKLGGHLFTGSSSKTIAIPDSNYKFNIEDWAEFIGWFILAGHIKEYDLDYTSLSLVFEHNYISRIKDFKNLIKRMGLEFTEYQSVFFDHSYTKLHSYLKRFNDKSLNCDYINYYELPINARKKLLNTIIGGDPEKNKTISFTTLYKNLANVVDRLAALNGYSTKYILEATKNSIYYNVIIYSDTVHKSYHINYSYVDSEDGFVYSLQVPGGLLYIRRKDGLSHWSGNSGKVGITLGLTSEIRKSGKSLYTPVRDLNNKIHWFSPQQMYETPVGFPDQFVIEGGKLKPLTSQIKVMYKNKTKMLPFNKVKYYLRSPRTIFSIQTNLIPFLSSTQGNRSSTGARMLGQALPLADPDKPLLETWRDHKTTYEQLVGHSLGPNAIDDGVVTKITDDYIYVKHKDGEKKYGLYKDFPLNQDGFVNSYPIVKVGDKIKKGDLLAGNNYTKGDRLALSKNLTTAFLSYKGLNFEDGIVVTESAAKKLTHETIHKENIYFSPKLTVFDKKKFSAWYPDVLSVENFNKLDDSGIIKKGQAVLPGDVIAAFLVEKEMSDLDNALKKLDKITFNKYEKKVVKWENDDPGVVIDVKRLGRNIDIYIKAKHPLKEGDKLCVDEKTEIFTKEGWKYLSELNKYDKYLTLNLETGKVEYQEASDLNIYRGGHSLIKLETDSINLCVTKNHNIVINKNDKLQLVPIEANLEKTSNYIKHGSWDGTDGEIPVLLQDYINDPSDFIKLSAFFILFGTTILDGEKGHNFRTIYYIDKNKYKDAQHELIDLFKRSNIKYHYRTDNRIRTYNKAIYYYFKNQELVFENYVPSIIKTFNSKLLRQFIEEFLKYPSVFKKPVPDSELEKDTIYLNSKKLVDDFSEIIIKAGYSFDIESTYFRILDGSIVASKMKIWKLKINKNPKPINISNKEYITNRGSRYVGGPTVPNGTIFIKRKGKTCWTGNSGLWGNKGVVTKVIPDEEAPHTEDGKVVEVMMSAEGVPGRMNIGQIHGTAAAKIADKTNKPFIVKNFDPEIKDYTKHVLKEGEKYGIKFNETLIDGKTGKKIKSKIFVGKQPILKLRHIISKKEGAHSYGTYDIYEQPAGKGVQKVGVLDTYAYLAHGANNNLEEINTIKGRKNEEYWRDLQFGIPPSKPNRNFIWEKMMADLKGMGVNVEKNGSRVRLMPLTDKDIEKLSVGEITDPGAMLIGKNLLAKSGGLFDKKLTGGPKGTNWTHFSLATRIPNPMFEMAIQSLLDITSVLYNDVIAGRKKLNGKTGTEAIVDALSKIDVKKLLKEKQKELKTAPPTNINKLNTLIKYLKALDDLKLSPKEAYTLSKIPVTPPKFRPIYPLPSGDLMVSDVNKHYRDVGIINNTLKQALKEDILDDNKKIKSFEDLYKSVKALQGLIDPITYTKQKYKGFMADFGKVKTGLVHGKAWSKKQDISGRSTITVDPDLGVDEVGIPKEMAYTMWKPFIIKNIKSYGLKASEAKKHYDNKTKLAEKALQNVTKERPVILNRAPTLHKHSIQAFKPVLVSDKSIRLNPLIFKGFNSDLDGDEQINSIIFFAKRSVIQRISEQQKKCNNFDTSLDFNEKNHYINHIINKHYVEDIMSSRYNVKLPQTKDGDYYLVNLEDFPYDPSIKLGTKNDIDFYAVPEGIKVFAYDESKKQIILTQVGGWSIHKNKEVWLIDLLNKKQIISDDDPRAVYGIDSKSDSLNMVRRRPEESIGVMVPYVKSLANAKNIGWPKTSVKGWGKLKDKINLTKEVGYVLGALVGDGWVDNVKDKYIRVNMSGIEKNVIDQYTKYLDYIFKESPHIGRRVGTASYGKSKKYVVSSSDFAKWVAPKIGKGAKNKHLPPMWFNAPREFKLGLLSGLLDTDGSVYINNSKSKKQLIYNFGSISLRLVQEVQQLLLTLGVSSSISLGKVTDVGNEYWSLQISSVDMEKIKYDLITAHQKNRQTMFNKDVTPNINATSAIRVDLVPITKDIIKSYMSKIGSKRNNPKHLKSLYAILHKSKTTGYITRATAKKLIDMYTDVKPPEDWIKIVKNDSISWSPVIKVTNTGKTETGYDLTVPGYETFMSIDGIILSNTMSIMTPVGTKAIEEAYSMLPSRILFKHGDNELMPELSKDYIFGLYKASLLGKNTGKHYKTINEAKKDKLELTDVFYLDGKKMTLGQYYINKYLPDELKDYSRPINKKESERLLSIIGKKYPHLFDKIINTWKELGYNYSYNAGHTISITDFNIDRKFRDNLIKKELPKIEKLNFEERVKKLNELTKKVQDLQNKQLQASNNNIKDMLNSGSYSKIDSVRQILSMPGVLLDVKGRPIDIPVLKSYGEGLDTTSYFNSLYAVRKGTVDRSVKTQETGALTKSLMSVARRLTIVEEDCNTNKYIEVEINSKDLLDRFAAITIPGVVKRNQLIDSEVIAKAKSKGLSKLPVRSPLTCESINGVCQKCYGLLPDGKIPPLGTNVGILDGSAVTERSSQLVMRTFHCFHWGTLVQTDNGDIRLIRDLVNENFRGKVLDSNGEYVQVLNTSKHTPTDEIKFVKFGGNLSSLIAQGNHPVMVKKLERLCTNCGSRNVIHRGDGNFYCKRCNNEFSKTINATYKYDIKELKHIRKSKETFSWSPFKLQFGTLKWDWNISPKEVGLYIIGRENEIKSLDQETLERLKRECGTKLKDRHLPFSILKYYKEDLMPLIGTVLSEDNKYSGLFINVNNHKSISRMYVKNYALASQLSILIPHLYYSYEVKIYPTLITKYGRKYVKYAVDIHATKERWYDILKGEIKIKPYNNLDKFSLNTERISLLSNVSLDPDEDHYVYDLTTKTGTLSVNQIYSHNSGGSALAGGGITSGFPHLKQLLQVPEKLGNKATLSLVDGIVEEVKRNSIGGYDIKIKGVKHITLPGQKILVKVGDKVSKGDSLSEGLIKPQELGQLKSHLDAQKYIVNEMDTIYGGKFNKRTFETIVRGVSDNAEITYAPEDSGFIRGDKTTISFVENINKQRKKENLPLIQYKPYFKSIETLNVDSDDWLTKVTTNRIKSAIQLGAAKGQFTNLYGVDPIPAYIYGDEFSKSRKMYLEEYKKLKNKLK